MQRVVPFQLHRHGQQEGDRDFVVYLRDLSGSVDEEDESEVPEELRVIFQAFIFDFTCLSQRLCWG